MWYRVYIDAKQSYVVEAISESAAKRIIEYTYEVKAQYVEEIDNDTKERGKIIIFPVGKTGK